MMFLRRASAGHDALCWTGAGCARVSCLTSTADIAADGFNRDIQFLGNLCGGSILPPHGQGPILAPKDNRMRLTALLVAG
ncbi:hypothetical protein ACQTO0_14425 [Brucella sp. NF 2815]|uniref:hypothetical protein n=1 Tax=unclassified Brucella TaxID=2632610 RepID=UPI003D0FB6B4